MAKTGYDNTRTKMPTLMGRAFVRGLVSVLRPGVTPPLTQFVRPGSAQAEMRGALGVLAYPPRAT